MKTPVTAAIVLATLGGGVAGFFVGKSGSQAGKEDTRYLVTDGTSGDLGEANREKRKKEGDADAASPDGVATGLSKLAQRIAAGEQFTLKDIFNEPGQMARIEALLMYSKSLSGEGVEEALAEMRQMPRSMDAMIAMQVLMGRYAELDPQKALEYASTLGGMGRGFGTGSILRTWAASDPVAASKYFADNLDADGNDWMQARNASSIASEWARQDATAALEWAQTLPENVRDEAMERAIVEMTAQDPEAAAAYALALDEGEAREGAISEIAEQWGRMDPVKALDWATGLSGEERVRAMQEVLDSWAGSSPTDAARYVDSLGDPEEKSKMLEDVADAWSRNGDPSAAIEWLNKQPESDGREDATREVVENWMRSDSVAASEYVGSMEAGSAKDQSINAMIRSRAMQSEPDAQTMWAAQISDAQQRSETVTRVAPRWLAEDRDAATEYILSVDIPAEQKTTLVSMTDEQLQQQAAQNRGGGFRRDGPPGRGRR